jgi:hypothetical protein
MIDIVLIIWGVFGLYVFTQLNKSNYQIKLYQFILLGPIAWASLLISIINHLKFITFER